MQRKNKWVAGGEVPVFGTGGTHRYDKHSHSGTAPGTANRSQAQCMQVKQHMTHDSGLSPCLGSECVCIGESHRFVRVAFSRKQICDRRPVSALAWWGAGPNTDCTRERKLVLTSALHVKNATAKNKSTWKITFLCAVFHATNNTVPQPLQLE